MVIRILRLIRKKIIERFTRPVSIGESEFVAMNRPFWKTPSNVSMDGSRILVYVAGDYITSIIEAMVVAKKISERYGYPIDVLDIDDMKYRLTREVYESFSIQGYADWNISLLKKICILFHAFQVWRNWKSVDDILKWETDGIPMGEELYDTLIVYRSQEYTVENIKLSHIKAVYAFCKNIYIAKHLFSANAPYSVFVFSDCDYERTPFAKYAMQSKCIVYQSCLGRIVQHKPIKGLKVRFPGQITHERYNMYRYSTTKEELDNYLVKHFAGVAKADLDRTAFYGKKQYSKEALCELAGVDVDDTRKFVVVAAHAFSDRPHLADDTIYRDYYQWLIETLSILEETEDIIVFVKEHPSAKNYGEKGSITPLVKKYGWKNINTLPDDFSTYSIFHFFDYVVTCNGTIGLEATTFGLPVFTAGKGYYAGFGIDINSSTKEEYENRLRYITRYKRRPQVLQDRAKMLLYILGQSASEYTLPMIPQDRFRGVVDENDNEKYRYRYINDHLKNCKDIKGRYYAHLLDDIIIFDDSVGSEYNEESTLHKREKISERASKEE